jgi:hypothetical protein
MKDLKLWVFAYFGLRCPNCWDDTNIVTMQAFTDSEKFKGKSIYYQCMECSHKW